MCSEFQVEMRPDSKEFLKPFYLPRSNLLQNRQFLSNNFSKSLFQVNSRKVQRYL